MCLQHNELLCANLQGDLAIFKENASVKFAYAENLGMVTACVIGDVMNSGKNFVIAIDMEGWLFIMSVKNRINSPSYNTSPVDVPQADDVNRQRGSTQEKGRPLELEKVYCQRMPANCKELLLADLDGDGQNELIIGLTDRVLRTYKWIKIGANRGKFVGIYKWEFADQIGSVSLTPSRHAKCHDIIVAQPGGTYAKLECYDKKLISSTNNVSDNSSEDYPSSIENSNTSPKGDDNVKTEYISKLTPEYHQLALGQMRNPHVSTEALGGIRNGKSSSLGSHLIALATLDGTLMLVDKDQTLWNLQVDHQLFALAVLETSSGSKQTLPQSESCCTIVANPCDLDDDRLTSHSKRGEQYFVACAWNGKTYIIDEDRNYLRFKFEEAISAFTAGNYYFDGRDHASLVYATFNNQLVLYYDVVSDPISPTYLLDEILNNPEYNDFLKKLDTLQDKLGMLHYGQLPEQINHPRNLHNLIHDILYNVPDEALGQ